MAKITRITTQKKNKHRYNIFLDHGQGEKFGFGVDEEVLIEHHLRKGLELDETMIQLLLKQDTYHQSYAQVIRYLGYRMRTKKEVRDYLVKKEVDEEHIAKIVQKLIERKLVDDQEFATLFVQTRIQTTTKGPGMVKRELMEKGVSERIANEAVTKYDYHIQYKKAHKIAEKRMKRSSKHSFRKQQEQLQVALLRNGFTQEIIRDVLENIENEDEAEEQKALHYHGERLFRRHSQKLTGYELKNKLKEALYRQGFTIEAINNYLDNEMGD